MQLNPSPEQTMQTLKRFPFFRGLQPHALQKLAEQVYYRRYERGSMVCMQGQEVSSFYLVVTGSVALSRSSGSGNQSIASIVGAGGSFAEAVALNRMPLPVNAMVVAESTIIEVPVKVVAQLIKDDADVALRIIAAISARHHFLVERIEQLSVKTAPQRLAGFLLKIAPQAEVGSVRYPLPYEKGLVASFLGMKAETFSRALSKLKQEGVLIEGKEVLIQDVAALATFCED